jgi:hypothetical protein
MIAQPYPLQWPRGVPRTKVRERGRFKKELTVHQAIVRVEDEVRRIVGANVSTLVISSNMAGTTRSKPDDPGIAVYFLRNKKTLCFPCDRYREVAQNIAAVAAHLEATRAMERWGVGTVEQLFSGFAALPAPGSDWRAVLGLQSVEVDREVIEATFRELARKMHPDAGGSHEGFVRLNEAREHALTEIGANA